MAHPRFSWVLHSSDRDVSQSAYRILVAGSEQSLGQNRGYFWDSGKVISRQSANVSFDGSLLESGKQYFWKVQVWDRNGNRSAWSEPASFRVGLLQPSDWTGQWIGANDPGISAPLLRREFRVNKPVKSAVVFVCGLGYYEMHLNGEKVGDHVLDPGTTDYYHRVLYATYDVTDRMKRGENALGVMLGNGWYSPPDEDVRMAWGGILRKYGDRPRLLLQLDLTFADGSDTSIVSDDNWRVSPGPIRFNSIWNGEAYDARLDRAGWTAPGYDDAGWAPATVLEAPSGVLDSQLMPPIRVTRTLAPVTIIHPQDGISVFDFGQNFAGWARLKVRGPAGTKIILKYGERIYKSGLVDQRSARNARAADTYILKGEGEEVYEPRFTYHGFRYVQVEGAPGDLTVDNLEGRVVHSAVEPAGRFVCSDSLLNRIHRNTVWSQRSNLYSIPTDCPVRDERTGAMADAQVIAEEAIYNFDMAPFYTKWLRDIADGQGEPGWVNDPTPLHPEFKSHMPAWQITYPLVAWYMYQYYGDVRILKEHYDGLKRLVDWLGSTATGDVLEWGRGDWVPPGRTQPDDGSVPVTSTGYYYLGARIIARAATILGKHQDAENYNALADQIRTAFNREFLNPKTNNYGSGSQTCNAFALYAGLVPEERQSAVAANIVRNIREEHDSHLWTGILGTKALVRVLPEYGFADVLYNVATSPTYPGWGYQIARGATTLWERWGGYKNFGAGMNSFNHVMFGSIDEFFYRNIAGIAPDSVGYRRVMIAPVPVDGLTFAEAEVQTISGKVVSRWEKTDRQFVLECAIPVNTTGEIHIPFTVTTNLAVRESGQSLWDNGVTQAAVPGIRYVAVQDGRLIIQTGSGRYRFVVTGMNDN